MNIVILTPEMMPYAKTGGLADVTGSLAKELKVLGHEVTAVIPAYQCLDLKKWNFRVAIQNLDVPIGSQKETGRVLEAAGDGGVKVYAIDHPEFFKRDGLYGKSMGDYPDNDRRFTFYQRGVLETLKILNVEPDVIHCHDWQTGLIPVYLKTLEAKTPNFKKARTVFTVHNLRYQGNFPPDSLPLTGLGWEEYKFEKLEFYGKVSFLKGGLVYADAVTTVSNRYAEQIRTAEFGYGFDGVLNARKGPYYGVLNGIDFREWNPETDPDIVAQYSLKKIDKKWINKNALQKEDDFKVDPKIPLVGMISRLVDQKGVDILISAMEKFPKMGIQFVLLGTGEERYHKVLREIAKSHKGHIGVHIVFDAKMAKRIYAGSDILVLPSYYEPCGLAQMIALRFGTIPVVRATGGLADTIEEYDPKKAKGNGFLFEEYTSEAFLEALERALRTFHQEKDWQRLVRNAMACDFSWTASAKKYLQIFEGTKRAKI